MGWIKRLGLAIALLALVGVACENPRAPGVGGTPGPYDEVPLEVPLEP